VVFVRLKSQSNFCHSLEKIIWSLNDWIKHHFAHSWWYLWPTVWYGSELPTKQRV